MKLSTENISVGVALVLLAFASYFFAGISGLRVIIGMLLISLPFYLLLEDFGLNKNEQVIFSIFSSVVIFTSLSYWLGFIVPFRISIIIVFALLAILAIATKRIIKRTKLS